VKRKNIMVIKLSISEIYKQPLCQKIKRMNQIRNVSLVCGFLLVVLASCVSNNQEKELKQLEQEVIELHDEVMPLMDPLYKIRKGLQEMTELDSANIELKNAINTIEIAEEAMMDWMRNYDMTFKGNDSAETLQYFSEKKKSIEQVAVDMKLAKKSGEELLNSKSNEND